MHPIDILPTIAEVAVTIAGFTAIVVSIRSQRAGTWNAEERIRIIGILTVCGLVAVCAVLPYAISDLSSNENLRWGVPLAVSGMASIIAFAIVVIAAAKRKFEFLLPQLTWPMMAVITGSSTLSILSGTGLWNPYSAGLLLLQLLAMLVACSITIVVTFAITYRRGNSIE